MMRWTGSPASLRESAARTNAAASSGTGLCGSSTASVRLVPVKCSTSSRASSEGSALPSSVSATRTSRSNPPSTCTGWSAIVEIGQQLRLVIGDQGIDDLVEFSHHHAIELVERQVDAVVGNATLWEVVGANTLGAIT